MRSQIVKFMNTTVIGFGRSQKLGDHKLHLGILAHLTECVLLHVSDASHTGKLL